MTNVEIKTAIEQANKDKASIQANIDALEKQLIEVKTGDKFRSVAYPDMVLMIMNDMQMIQIESGYRYQLGFTYSVAPKVLTDTKYYTKIN